MSAAAELLAVAAQKLMRLDQPVVVRWIARRELFSQSLARGAVGGSVGGRLGREAQTNDCPQAVRFQRQNWLDPREQQDLLGDGLAYSGKLLQRALRRGERHPSHRVEIASECV